MRTAHRRGVLFCSLAVWGRKLRQSPLLWQAQLGLGVIQCPLYENVHVTVRELNAPMQPIAHVSYSYVSTELTDTQDSYYIASRGRR